MNTATPSARMLLDYVADLTLVTVADVAAYFEVSQAVALDCMLKVGLISPDADGTFEIDGGDPDDALDLFGARVGVDFLDLPIADLPIHADEPEPEPEPEPELTVTASADDIAFLLGLIGDLQSQVEALRARVDLLEGTSASTSASTSKAKPRKKLQLPGMIEAGLVHLGDRLRVHGHSGEGLLAADRCVRMPNGDFVKLNKWAEELTGWSAVNIYENIVHVPTGKTLEVIRIEAAS